MTLVNAGSTNETTVKAELRWDEMMWSMTSEEFPYGRGVGEAGNSSYHVSAQVSAMRFGNEVLIHAPTAWEKDRRLIIIPADTVIYGFGQDIDGMTLAEKMEDGFHYDFTLRRLHSYQ